MANERSQDDQQLARLFRYAKPRDELSSSEQEEMYGALRAEWRQRVVTGRRKYWQPLALAASVVMLFVLGLVVIKQDPEIVDVPAVKVASLTRVTGDGYSLLDGGGNKAGNPVETDSLMSGFQLKSDDRTLLALELASDGTLRVDAATHIEFNSDRSITLHNGRVYFDSGRAPGDEPVYQLSDSRFVLRTAGGDIRHVGTQFSVTQSAKFTNVQVREGAVQVANDRHDVNIEAGRQVTISDTAALQYGAVQTFGEQWLWTERIVPVKSFHNRRIHDFVTWVARETGRELVYADAQAEVLAREHSLVGEVLLPPLEALTLRLQTAKLRYTQEAGQLVIHRQD